jgi:tetratricopeptide (TPR) repeat protein
MAHHVAPAEIERRLHWRWFALVGFGVMILTLAVLAAVSLLVPPRRVAGLPDDPGVRAVAAALQGRLPMRTGGLRFRSALAGEAAPDAVFGAAETQLADQAAATLERAAARRRGDPRLEVALGHLDLARLRLLPAERRYRAVTERGLDAAEARLGLGVTLTLEARTERDALRARGIRLEALAQFVAVTRDAPAYAVALYDRALLLAELGRAAEAGAVAREYLALDPSGPWADRLRRALAAAAE